MSSPPSAFPISAAVPRLPRNIRFTRIFLVCLLLLTACGTVTNRNLGSAPSSAANFGSTLQGMAAPSNPMAGNGAAFSASGYDGPAQLPIATVASSMADTPAPGSTISVASGGDLQSALNNAYCGDTIELEAGATFTGGFTFPALNCDSAIGSSSAPAPPIMSFPRRAIVLLLVTPECLPFLGGRSIPATIRGTCWPKSS